MRQKFGAQECFRGDFSPRIRRRSPRGHRTLWPSPSAFGVRSPGRWLSRGLFLFKGFGAGRRGPEAFSAFLFPLLMFSPARRRLFCAGGIA